VLAVPRSTAIAFAGKNELDLLKGQNIQMCARRRGAPGKGLLQ
jgi:hypothetical protein